MKKITNKETVERNLSLTFDLIRQIIDKPALVDQIPDQSIIEFVEKDRRLKYVNKINEYNGKKGYWTVQIRFRLFWFIPTPWWRAVTRKSSDLVDGDFIETAWFETKAEAQEFLKNY